MSAQRLQQRIDPRRSCESWSLSLTFWPPNKRVSRTHGGLYVCVKFGDASCVAFSDTVYKNKRTNERERRGIPKPWHDYCRRG